MIGGYYEGVAVKEKRGWEVRKRKDLSGDGLVRVRNYFWRKCTAMI